MPTHLAADARADRQAPRAQSLEGVIGDRPSGTGVAPLLAVPPSQRASARNKRSLIERLLHKPFTCAAVARKVREVIDAETASMARGVA